MTIRGMLARPGRTRAARPDDGSTSLGTLWADRPAVAASSWSWAHSLAPWSGLSSASLWETPRPARRWRRRRIHARRGPATPPTSQPTASQPIGPGDWADGDASTGRLRTKSVKRPGKAKIRRTVGTSRCPPGRLRQKPAPRLGSSRHLLVQAECSPSRHGLRVVGAGLVIWVLRNSGAKE